MSEDYEDNKEKFEKKKKHRKINIKSQSWKKWTAKTESRYLKKKYNK